VEDDAAGIICQALRAAGIPVRRHFDWSAGASPGRRLQVATCVCKHGIRRRWRVCMTHCPFVMINNLTTCYSVESALFQRLKLRCDEPLSISAFNVNSRRYTNNETC